MTTPTPGMIDLTLQGSALTSNAFTPKVTINGYPVPAVYGFNRIPMPPGPARIDISCRWIFEYGRAMLDVEVRPGEAVPVFYAAPLHQLSAGSIGHVPQKRPGLAGLIAILAGIIIVAGAMALLGTLNIALLGMMR